MDFPAQAGKLRAESNSSLKAAVASNQCCMDVASTHRQWYVLLNIV